MRVSRVDAGGLPAVEPVRPDVVRVSGAFPVTPS